MFFLLLRDDSEAAGRVSPLALTDENHRTTRAERDRQRGTRERYESLRSTMMRLLKVMLSILLLDSVQLRGCTNARVEGGSLDTFVTALDMELYHGAAGGLSLRGVDRLARQHGLPLMPVRVFRELAAASILKRSKTLQTRILELPVLSETEVGEFGSLQPLMLQLATSDRVGRRGVGSTAPSGLIYNVLSPLAPSLNMSRSEAQLAFFGHAIQSVDGESCLNMSIYEVVQRIHVARSQLRQRQNFSPSTCTNTGCPDEFTQRSVVRLEVVDALSLRFLLENVKHHVPTSVAFEVLLNFQTLDSDHNFVISVAEWTEHESYGHTFAVRNAHMLNINCTCVFRALNGPSSIPNLPPHQIPTVEKC